MSKHPGPAFVIAKAPLTTPLIVKSGEAVPLSSIVKVRAAVNTTKEDMVAPLAPVPEFVTVTLPPSLKEPVVPVIDEPVIAPQYNCTLEGAVVVPKENVVSANVDPAVTVNAPLILVAALSVTIFPGLLIVTLAGVFWLNPVPVTCAEVPLYT
jgi:hypothetical protein